MLDIFLFFLRYIILRVFRYVFETAFIEGKLNGALLVIFLFNSSFCGGKLLLFKIKELYFVIHEKRNKNVMSTLVYVMLIGQKIQ